MGTTSAEPKDTSLIRFLPEEGSRGKMGPMSVSGTDLSTPVLLLAMPQVLDPFFHRSVVLLLHHEEEGSFGFIINRPTGIRVTEILKGMEVDWRGEGGARAHVRRPVPPPRPAMLAP